MFLIGHAALGVDDQAARRKENVGHRNRLGEKAARIVSQIEHQGPRALILERGEGFLHLPVRAALEAADAYVGDIAGQHPASHALDAAYLARDGELYGFLLPFAPHRDLHLRSGLAPKPLDDFLEREVLRRLLFDEDDLIARLHADLIRRGIFDGRHHGQHAVSNRNLHAQATEAARGFDLHLLEVFGTQVGRMGVQRAEHAPDGAANELPGVHLVDVILLHQAQHLAEGPQLRIRARLARRQIRNGTHRHPRDEQRQNAHPNHPPGQTIFFRHLSLLRRCGTKKRFYFTTPENATQERRLESQGGDSGPARTGNG